MRGACRTVLLFRVHNSQQQYGEQKRARRVLKGKPRGIMFIVLVSVIANQDYVLVIERFHGFTNPGFQRETVQVLPNGSEL